jgi:hypothetical protein
MPDETKSITLPDPRSPADVFRDPPSFAEVVPEPTVKPWDHEGPFPETIVHMRLTGESRKYIPVDGEELKGMLAAVRRKALEDAAHLVDATNYYESNELIAARIRNYDGARK